MTYRLLIRVMLYALISFAIPSTAYLTDLLYFQTNDDFTMMLISSGILYGSPSSDIRFLAKPLAIFLALMYTFSQNYSWYTISLLATQGLSIFAYLLLLDDVWRIKAKSQRFLVLLLLSTPLLIATSFFFSIQFTQTAVMAAGLGALLLFYSTNRYQTVLAVFLIILGIFWRPNAGFLGIVIVFSFFTVNQVINKKLTLPDLKLSRMIILLAVTGVSFLIYFVGSHEKSPFLSSEQQFAMSYYDSYKKVLDYQPTLEARKLLKDNSNKVGWTKNDFNLFVEKFYFANKDIYTIDRNLKLEEITSPLSKIDFFSHVSIKLNNILLTNHKQSLVLIFLFFLLSFLIFQKNNFFYLFLYLAIIYVILLLILNMGRIPDRLIMPIFFLAMSTLAIMLFKFDSRILENGNSQKFPMFLISAISSFFFVLVSLNLYNKYLEIDEEYWWKSAGKNRISGFDRVLEYKPDRPIIAFSSFYSALLKTHSPTKPPSQTEDIWKNMILVGWTIRSPEMDKKLEASSIDEDLFTSIASQRAYLATSDHLVEIAYITTYLKQHKYIDIEWAVGPFIYNDTGLGIWKIESFEPIDLGE